MSFDLYRYYNLSTPKEIFIKGGKSGLKNKSAYCYLNSIIHCLAATLPLTDYIFTKKIKHNDYNTIPYTSLSRILYKLFHENFIVDSSGFANTMKKVPGTQYDSAEVLLEILNHIHYAVKYKAEFTINGQDVTKSDLLIRKGFESWIEHFKESYSFVIDNFYGNIISTCSNNKCKHSKKFDIFNSLMIPIEDGSKTLNECLDCYFNRPTTCICKKGVITSRLWNLPDTLIINFKRYKSNLSKINDNVEFPLDLNMNSSISPLKNDNNNYLYSLYAVNYHSGSCDSGHYWSCCKDITGEWYKYDDENVEKINNINEICNGHDAYILFYQRVRILVTE